MVIKTSAIAITEMRGTAGGSTASNGKGGAFIRNRVKPTNPQSQRQTTQRSKFSQDAQAFRNLTQAQRDDWNTAAASGQYNYKNKVGSNIAINGNTLYNAINGAIVSAGGTPVADVPLQVGLGNALITSGAAAAGTPALTVIYTGTLGTDESLVLFGTYGVSAGRGSGSNYKRLGVAGFTGASPINALAAYTAIFGTLTEGAKIFIKANLVNELTGEYRLAGEVAIIVAA